MTDLTIATPKLTENSVSMLSDICLTM